MPSGNIGYNPLKGTRELGVASLNLQNSDVAIQGLNDSFKAYSIAQQNQQTRMLAEDKNLKLNSLKGLYMQAYDNPDFAAKSAASMFNRIESATDKESVNKLYQELDTIHEKAQDNKYLFDLAEVGDSVVNWYGRLNPFGMDRPQSLKKSKEKLLRENNSDLGEISKWMTPTDLLGNVKNHVNEVDYKNFGANLLKSFKSPDELNVKLKKALSSPTPQNSLDDILNLKLQDNFVTRGNDFYREGPEAAQFQKDALNAFKNPDDITKKYYKYDLENETLGSLKASVAKELTGLLQQPDSKENAQKIASYRQSLELIDKRQKDNSKIYGVNKYEDPSARFITTGRGGALNAFTSGVVDLSNGMFRDDFEGAIYKKALYQPQIASYDSKGRPVMSNQFMYEKEDGSTGFNFGAIPEAGLQMVSQMLPVLAGGALIGGVVGGIAGAELGAVSRGAASLTKGYERLNKVSAFKKSTPLIGGELNIADRIATFATVTANTLPTMIAEEKKWGGNYFKRATGKAVVEGLTEGIGFPDIGALKFKRFEADLTTAAKRAAGVELKFSDNLRNYMNSTKQFVVTGAKQNAVEALEEELSLLGNALLEGSVMPEEFVGRDKTEVTGEAMLDTFVESFAAGAIYSGITTGFQGFASGNKTHVQNQADWEAANNPELFKAKLKELNGKGGISDQQYAQSVLEVNRKAAILKGLFGFDNIRDAKTLLEDKDEQYSYYINHLRQDELVNIDYDQLTDQEKQVFANRKISDKINTKGRERMDSIRKDLGNLSREEQTPETLSKVQNLYKEYQSIRRANIKTLNKKELTVEEERVLKEKGILGEKDFEYTKADLDAELSKVSTDILKTQKRIEKYANLSEDDKAKVISDAYDEKITGLGDIADPNELVQSRLNLEQDINYLKLKGNYKDKAQIANRERLLDAYGERFGQLVNDRDDSGRNSIEQSIENINYEGLESSSDYYQATQLLNQIESNRDFINQDMFDLASENLKKTQERILAGLLEATPEKRAEVLATFLDQAAPTTATYAYNVDKVNEEFPGLEFTVEELDAAREAFIQRRAEVRSAQVADQPRTDLTSEESEDIDTFSKNMPTEEEVNSEVDESGKSPVTEGHSKTYTDALNVLKNRFAQDYPSKFVEFLINNIANNFSRNTREFEQLKDLFNQLMGKQISETQFNQAVGELEAKLQKELKLRKQNKRDYQTVQDKLNFLDRFKYMANRFAREESIPVSTAASIKAATPKPVASNDVSDVASQQVAKSFPALEIKDKTLNAQLQVRMERLKELVTPLRSVAVEINSEDIMSTDPANIRNSKAIDYIAEQPFQARLQSRKGIVLSFLRQKFPEKTAEQIAADFATIEQVFANTDLTEKQWLSLGQEEQDVILQPIHDLLGKEYFDRGTLKYFIVNKGGGFTVNSAVVMTVVNADKSLVTFEGFPFEASLPSGGRVSEKAKEAYEKQGGSAQDLQDTHKQITGVLARAIPYLSENTDKSIDTDYTTSYGFVLKTASQQKAAEVQEETVANAKLPDFELAETAGQTIFGKTFKFTLGRLYFNNNGTPVVLSNTNIQEEEANALAELLFSENLPKEFPDQNSLERYLVSLINIIDRKNRIHFFPNPNFPSTTDAVQYPLDIIQTTYAGDKPVYKKLNKEEFKEFLSKSFYKADKSMLSTGDPMLRVSLVDSKPIVTKQSYVDYIKDTHTFPVSSTGELLRPLNKAVFPDTEDFIKKSVSLVPGVQPEPKPIAPKPVEVKPVVPVVDSNSETLYTASHKDIIEYTENSPVAQSLGLHSLFKQGGMFYDKAAYEQALQSINDNPNVVYQVVVRQVKEGKGITAKQVPYSPNIEGDFILAIIPTDKAGIPVILLRKDDAELAGIDLSQSSMSITGTSAENFVSQSTQEKPVAPVAPPKPVALSQSIEDKKTFLQKEKQEAIDRVADIEDNLLPKINNRLANNLQPELAALSKRLQNTKDENLKKEINNQIDKLEKLRLSKSNAAELNRQKESFEGQLESAKRFIEKKNMELAALGQSTPSKQSLTDRLNSQGAGEMFDKEEAKEAQKAKEDCINPAKQVRDQIKKKPKL